ncbi:MAG: hypothetical protein F9K32_01710 [Desulfobulbaceae bacterium]|nr:MAG: hypothetical protein F9K32_01710 [Desulfobulbaceae bacterium]
MHENNRLFLSMPQPQSSHPLQPPVVVSRGEGVGGDLSQNCGCPLDTDCQGAAGWKWGSWLQHQFETASASRVDAEFAKVFSKNICRRFCDHLFTQAAFQLDWFFGVQPMETPTGEVPIAGQVDRHFVEISHMWIKLDSMDKPTTVGQRHFSGCQRRKIDDQVIQERHVSIKRRKKHPVEKTIP